jgi:biopolymer transport protein ExbD
MKDKSPRVKRHARLQKRLKAQANLNLTSLMDIFTILVFFLIS